MLIRFTVDVRMSSPPLDDVLVIPTRQHVPSADTYTVEAVDHEHAYSTAYDEADGDRTRWTTMEIRVDSTAFRDSFQRSRSASEESPLRDTAPRTVRGQRVGSRPSAMDKETRSYRRVRDAAQKHARRRKIPLRTER